MNIHNPELRKAERNGRQSEPAAQRANMDKPIAGVPASGKTLKDGDTVTVYSFRTGGNVEFRFQRGSDRDFYLVGDQPAALTEAELSKRHRRRAAGLIAMMQASHAHDAYHPARR